MRSPGQEMVIAAAKLDHHHQKHDRSAGWRGTEKCTSAEASSFFLVDFSTSPVAWYRKCDTIICIVKSSSSMYCLGFRRRAHARPGNVKPSQQTCRSSSRLSSLTLRAAGTCAGKRRMQPIRDRYLITT
ncbi:hypothetical protein PISMIDRAFT_156431 [Pisolithus microcarpus 441]|uniref:Uncharacterized protein n=1 Tax=Pisolithus microcarpus 441 TaxID=765257 RepID=A0A0C9ZA51_9AGAM|nr:hypothetical protein PISMIDRAFT_156431 [Pisolithus microcarpus 441]